jgi:2-polyprenyl-3-methyl-5-hydroxy-6-metoxy-1,4-benzoquinol methylase
MVEIKGTQHMIMQSCPLCESPSPQIFFQRRKVPVHQNQVCATAEEARQFTRGDLLLAFCAGCGFVFNTAFDPGSLRFSAAYDNFQSCSPYFQHYLTELGESLLTKYRLHGKVVIEVGCGKGEFLRLLCKDGRNRGVGFDPAYVGPDTAEGGAVRFVRGFYDSQQTPYAPDFVCCRHVIEHLQSPLEMLRAVRQAIGNRVNSYVYFETPALPWILDTVTFWDFFYEHCSYFTSECLAWAFEQTGFQPLETHLAFDEQYLCIEAKPTLAASTAGAPRPRSAPNLWSKIQSFLARLQGRMEACEEKIDAFARAGGCAIWGAAAKGTTLVNTIDPHNHRIRFLIDINPAKQGKYVPGTGHPIVSPSYLREQRSRIAGIVNMNPNYLEENRAIVAQMSLAIPIVQL